jgi:hypothetical protein
MKIKEFLKQMNVQALAVAKIKTKLNNKSLTLVKTPVTL